MIQDVNLDVCMNILGMEIDNIAMSTGHGRGHGCEVNPTYVTSKRCAFIIGQNFSKERFEVKVPTEKQE